MSNFLAIATVTTTLALEVVRQAAMDAVSAATVTMVRPDGTDNTTAGARVNIYLYQVTSNAAWRNNDLPTRNSDGQLIQRPCVAVDLHYLLTFYGDDGQLEPQRMLGNVALAMHTKPMLTREMIRNTIVNTLYPFLAESNLADAIELVKFTPLPLSLEELSKMWSIFFQTKYALSMAYQATVVLIEAEVPARAALPVLEREIFVVPFRHPTIERIRSEAGEFEPILSDSTIVIEGKQLRGDITQLRIGGSDLMSLQNPSDTRIVFPLSSIQPAGSLRAGVQAVQIIQSMMMGHPRVEHVGVESNVAPMVVRPTLTKITVVDSTTIMIEFDPPIGKTQRVLLLLNDLKSPTSSSYAFIAPRRASYQVTDRTLAELKVEEVPDAVLNQLSQIKDKEYKTEDDFLKDMKNAIGNQETQTHGSLILKYAGPDADNDSITFHISGVGPGDYLLRVQVDGAESVLQVDKDENSPTLGQIIGPKVTIP
jgi:hypothetical protein